MENFYVDLHIHIGRAQGKPVKITAAKNLTLTNIMEECINRKGIQIIGIIDCGSPLVQKEIEELVEKGTLIELADGGIKYKEQIVVIPGAEVETVEEDGGVAHTLCFFPDLKSIKAFTQVISKYIKNVSLSSQRARLNFNQLVGIVIDLSGEVIPAHVFTPYKSIYGNCTNRLRSLVDSKHFDKISAVELGLSSDRDLADCIAELKDKSFVSNSDAHSLGKIGREYNIFRMKEANYKEFFLALKRNDERGIIAITV